MAEEEFWLGQIETRTWRIMVIMHAANALTAVGFEPTQLALVELESTPSDHSGKLS